MTNTVYMSSGVFRGKEFSNRIELSQLVLVFWAPCSSGGGGGWGGGFPHTCAPACTHMHTHTHTHACMVNMIISYKLPPPLGNLWEFPMMSYACVHAHAYGCVWGHLSTPPTPSTHPHPSGGTPESVKIQ